MENQKTEHEVKREAFVKACGTLGLYNESLASYFRRLYDVFEDQNTMVKELPECKGRNERNYDLSRSFVRDRFFNVWITLQYSVLAGVLPKLLDKDIYKVTYPGDPGTRTTPAAKRELRRAFNDFFRVDDDSFIQKPFLREFNRRLQIDAIMLKVSSKNISCGLDQPDLYFDNRIKNWNEVYAGYVQAIAFYSILAEPFKKRAAGRKRK